VSVLALLWNVAVALADERPLPGGDPIPNSQPLPSVHPGSRRTGPWVQSPTVQGFRIGIDGDRSDVALRFALVKDFDGALYEEGTLRAQLAYKRLGLAVDLAGVAGQSELWSSGGLGNATLAFDLRFGRRSTHALGLLTTLPIGAAANGKGPEVAYWGTEPRTTIPMAGLAIFYAGSTARWTWRSHLGLEAFRPVNGGFPVPTDLGFGLAYVAPLLPGYSLGAEAELTVWKDPVQLRGWVRREFDAHWTLDLGLAMPIPVFFTDPSVQAVGSVSRRW
jgi:hypothetical protein